MEGSHFGRIPQNTLGGSLNSSTSSQLIPNHRCLITLFTTHQRQASHHVCRDSPHMLPQTFELVETMTRTRSFYLILTSDPWKDWFLATCSSKKIRPSLAIYQTSVIAGWKFTYIIVHSISNLNVFVFLRKMYISGQVQEVKKWLRMPLV